MLFTRGKFRVCLNGIPPDEIQHRPKWTCLKGDEIPDAFYKPSFLVSMLEFQGVYFCIYIPTQAAWQILHSSLRFCPSFPNSLTTWSPWFGPCWLSEMWSSKEIIGTGQPQACWKTWKFSFQQKFNFLFELTWDWQKMVYKRTQSLKILFHVILVVTSQQRGPTIWRSKSKRSSWVSLHRSRLVHCSELSLEILLLMVQKSS